MKVKFFHLPQAMTHAEFVDLVRPYLDMGPRVTPKPQNWPKRKTFDFAATVRIRSVDKALEMIEAMDQMELDGRRITVEAAEPDSHRRKPSNIDRRYW